jgi:hypothetical protein
MCLYDLMHFVRLHVYYEYNRFSSAITKLNALIHHTADIDDFSLHLFIHETKLETFQIKFGP